MGWPSGGILALRSTWRGRFARESPKTHPPHRTGHDPWNAAVHGAPEQVEGADADARTDIFALGTMIYEMTTGKRAFAGTSQASLSGAILHVEPPPISTVRPLTPRRLEHIVKRCLAKDPELRWQSAADVALELKWTAENLSEPAEQAGTARASPVARWQVGALSLVVAAARLDHLPKTDRRAREHAAAFP